MGGSGRKAEIPCIIRAQERGSHGELGEGEETAREAPSCSAPLEMRDLLESSRGQKKRSQIATKIKTDQKKYLDIVRDFFFSFISFEQQQQKLCEGRLRFLKVA